MRECSTHALEKSIEESVVHIQLLKQQKSFLSLDVSGQIASKRNKEGGMFFLAPSLIALHPGLEGAEPRDSLLRWRTWEQPFLRPCLHCKFQPSQISFVLLKLLPGINTTKELCCTDVLKKSKTNLCYQPNKVNYQKYFCVKHYIQTHRCFEERLYGQTSLATKVEYDEWNTTFHNTPLFLMLPLWRIVNVKDQWWGTSSQNRIQGHSHWQHCGELLRERRKQKLSASFSV